MPLRCAHLLFIVHLSQVTAVDLDGPPNNFIFYSIVSGNPKQQFSIDPRSGHITVRSMLDREEVSSVEFGEEMGASSGGLFYQRFGRVCFECSDQRRTF